MQTQSHLLVAAALITPLRRSSTEVHAPAVLVGAILPDIPFFLLTIAGEVYYRWLATPPPTASIMEYLHFTLFYQDPLWLVSHNLFHSLVINGLLVGIGLWGGQRRTRWGAALLWLALSMLLHVAIDIFTHQSDGPLIWFPLDWSYRFASPVSYWEAAHYGRAFMLFEYALDAALLVYLLFAWRSSIRRWAQRRRSQPPTAL